MGVFDRIKSAIFGRRAQAGTPGANRAGTARPGATPAPATSTASTQAATASPRPAAPPPRSAAPAGAAGAAAGAAAGGAAAKAAPVVDVEEVLEEIAREKGQPSNWRTSIVDLMKLLDLDSSLENRKELAQELGYTGSTSDSATMNVWLHKQVMRRLEENGGKVPADLRD